MYYIQQQVEVFYKSTSIFPESRIHNKPYMPSANSSTAAILSHRGDRDLLISFPFALPLHSRLSADELTARSVAV
jgi:hypothetical protein